MTGPKMFGGFKEPLRSKLVEYDRLLTCKDPRVQDFVKANEGDGDFMLVIKLHASLVTGILEGIRQGRPEINGG